MSPVQLILPLLIALGGCSVQREGTHGHEMFSEELTGLMRRLEASVYERELTEPQIEEKRREASAYLALNTRSLAAALAREAGGTDQPYRKYVSRLNQLADELEKIDQAVDYRQAYQSIQNTCEGCHAEFR